MPLLRNKHRNYDPVWHVEVIMLAVVALQLLLPYHFVFGARWLIPGLELILMVLLLATTPRKSVYSSSKRRLNVLFLLLTLALGNVYALIQVASQLLQSGKIDNGRELIMTALNIYLTNIVIFALLYWEMDAGGPGNRAQAKDVDRDFLFPQSQMSSLARWRPTFIDYLYVSSTNSMAFSPTDTLPLTRRAKMSMLLQGLISLVVIALVAARAVNILS